MDTIRVMYECDEGTWIADSPDFEALSGSRLLAGDGSYDAARARIEDFFPWALERDDIVIEHFVHESSLPALIAERERATRKPVAAAAKR
jgi:hypothetical protein